MRAGLYPITQSPRSSLWLYREVLVGPGRASALGGWRTSLTSYQRTFGPAGRWRRSGEPHQASPCPPPASAERRGAWVETRNAYKAAAPASQFSPCSECAAPAPSPSLLHRLARCTLRMGKKKDQPTSSPSKRPTPPSAPLEVEGTPVEDRSAKGKRRSDGAGASPSAPPHQQAKEATAEPEGKHQKKEKKEKRARKEKAETPAAEAEGDRDDGEKKEKKHKKSKAAQDSASIAASLSGYAAGDLSKSLFGGGASISRLIIA